ncbi:/ nagA_1 / N-acetylglucosamine-6-phosphate deacetylase /:360912 Forward [Candidatus Hepatoplasma crinochetorum]|uniref:/ nagA_1 / N-acetylglucosamine-6-phosphate deacetylase /:360912 Forward n=1 Tax=Candidatus Hepatoplasma crinochetorum TaxID=295596 RepID=A0A0G7ZN14_9MOLU|nr:/ nagA_1 / N-acetylglucosamine-6-phosphate deacetylase /:360912 Forward [Candidatus Hepatoplasma crinochetorum]
MKKTITGYDYKNRKIKIIIDNGKIMSTRFLKKMEYADDFLVIPGFIDIHTYGGYGFDWLNGKEENVLKYLKDIAIKEGVTSVTGTLPTLDVQSLRNSFKNLSNLIGEKVDGANFLGWNIEGPFIDENKLGSFFDRLTVRKLTIYNIDRYFKNFINTIKIMTIDPKDASQEIIDILKSNGVKIFAGHTKAEKKDIMGKAVDGITHFNHEMIKMGEKQDSLAKYALKSNDLYIEFINDRIHHNLKESKKIYKKKNAKYLILITDSLPVKGLKNGEYVIFNRYFEKKDQAVYNNKGEIVGSVHTMLNAFKYWHHLGASLRECVLATSTNAAKLLNLNKGKLSRGYDADILILDRKKFKIKKVYINGEELEENKEEEK